MEEIKGNKNGEGNGREAGRERKEEKGKGRRGVCLLFFKASFTPSHRMVEQI